MGESKISVKTREYHSHSIDSAIWNDFVFRDDDIIIGTYAGWLDSLFNFGSCSSKLVTNDAMAVTRI